MRIELDGRDGAVERVLVVVTPGPGDPAILAVHLSADCGGEPLAASYHLHGLRARVVLPLAIEVGRAGWLRADVERVGGGRWTAIRRLTPAAMARCRNT